jgi:hypothetical protein
MGGLAVAPVPQRGQIVRFTANTLAIPQHEAEVSKRQFGCPAKKKEIFSLSGLPKIYEPSVIGVRPVRQ